MPTIDRTTLAAYHDTSGARIRKTARYSGPVSYVNPGGDSFTPANLGMSRIDVLFFTPAWDGADAVRLLLPAPLDSRFIPRLNATNGTAMLRLVSDVGGLALELTTDRNVSFEIRVDIVDVPFNRTMTRFVPSTPPEQSGTAAATIDLTSIGGGGADVRLSLRIEFNEFCFSTRHALDASIVPGASSYPVASTVTTC